MLDAEGRPMVDEERPVAITARTGGILTEMRVLDPDATFTVTWPAAQEP